MTIGRTVNIEKDDGYMVLTLNRPAALNALNTQTYIELRDILKEITDDDTVKAFIITGSPRKDRRPCFCAGADIKEMAGRVKTGDLGKRISPVRELWTQTQPRIARETIFENIAWCPKISIAAIDGICTAGGTELALSCDLIYVAKTAEISDMHVKNMGWIGGAAATANMAWRIGVAKSIELCCTGDIIDGVEARRIGFANQVFPSSKLIQNARETAKKIGKMRLAAVTAVKATCRSVQDMNRKSSWYYVDDMTDALRSEPDADAYGPSKWIKNRKHT